MNLDQYEEFKALDPENMLQAIDSLPDQLTAAWELGQSLSVPVLSDLHSILIAGMGGSAIGADLLAAYIADQCPVPVVVHRDYGLPAWAKGPGTLVIASSHSGNTEETLSAFAQARANGCKLLAVSTGGKLSAEAEAAGVPAWKFEHAGQPRAAVGFSFGLLLAVFAQLKLIRDPEAELRQAVADMREQQMSIRANVLVERNPAKRLAGQLYGRWVTVLASGLLTPVARRWKGQISELAKAWAQFEFLPEADHNTLAGLLNPEDLLSRSITLFLRAPSDLKQNRLRSDLTRKSFMVEGLNTDFVDAKGQNPLSHLWTTLHLGDYTAYYLAMMYGVDPTPVAAIESFKQEMKKAAG